MPHRVVANNPIAVAGIVFLVSGSVEYVMNDLWAHQHPYNSSIRYLDCVVVAAVIASLFYLWRRQYAFYFRAVKAYSDSRRVRAHRIRSILQVMMFRAGDDEEMIAIIRSLDAVVDEPMLDPLRNVPQKQRIFRGRLGSSEPDNTEAVQ